MLVFIVGILIGIVVALKKHRVVYSRHAASYSAYLCPRRSNSRPRPRENFSTSTQQNIARVYDDPATTDRDRASIDELLAAKAWTELDDRFFRDIAFGTGGMRGRTIGKIVTKAEAGRPQPLDRPEFPGTGTNMLNFGNVHRAVSALGAYLIEGYPGEKLSVVIAHDTRYFLAANSRRPRRKSLNALGIDALLFAEDRSTPQLSFTTRVAGAHAGHHDHRQPQSAARQRHEILLARTAGRWSSRTRRASRNISRSSRPIPPRCPRCWRPSRRPARSSCSSPRWMSSIAMPSATLVLEPEAILETRDKIKFVYTPLHGTGIRAIPALLDQFGFRYSIVEAQARAMAVSRR